MSGSKSDKAQSVLGSGLKIISFTLPIIQTGVQVLSVLNSSSESKSLQRQELQNDTKDRKKSSESVLSYVENVVKVVKPAAQIASKLVNVYEEIKRPNSVNSNYTPCCSRGQNKAHPKKETQKSADFGSYKIAEPVLQKKQNLRQSTAKGMQSENKLRCNICKATADIKVLGLSPCQHIVCYHCLILVTRCVECGKSFRREDFQRLY